MTNPLPGLAACIAVVLLSAGCNKPEPIGAPPDTNSSKASTTISPKLPDPVVPKGDMPPAPHPGQGNDTSSPAFKNGGAPDPHK